jgi:hypothetical protein
MEKQENNLEQKGWFRIAKVVYIFLYLFFAAVLVGAGIENFYEYSVDGDDIIYTPGLAFLNVLVALIVGFISIKAIKITFLYIVLAQKPHWKKELTRMF